MNNINILAEIKLIGGYIWPSRLLPQSIVVLLSLLFVAWLVKLFQHCSRVKYNHQEILKLEDVSGLVSALSASTEIGDKTAEDNFKTFLSVKKLSESSPVVKHVKAIYLAGYNQARFDANALITYTLHKLFPGVQVLKGVLSTFIIIGLLGTLIGIADSFAFISNDKITTSLIKESISKVMTATMKTAFAPSIIGVFMTIIGVIIYIFYYQYKCCKPLRDDLERLTITVWVPSLYPTTTEKIKDITKENLKVVESVAVFANDVHDNIEDLKEKTNEATQSIIKLSQAVNLISNSALKIDAGLSKNIDLFSTNVIKLTSFQSELTNLYTTLSEDSKYFRAHVKQTLDEQNKWFPDLIKSLKSYEDVYIKGREMQDADMHKLILEATSGFESLTSKNLQKIEGVSASLDKNLGDIHDSMKINLSNFAQSLNSFVVPVEGAAENMSRTFQNLARTVQDIISDLNNSILTVIHKKIPSENPDIVNTLKELLVVMGTMNSKLQNSVFTGHSTAKEYASNSPQKPSVSITQPTKPINEKPSNINGSSVKPLSVEVPIVQNKPIGSGSLSDNPLSIQLPKVQNSGPLAQNPRANDNSQFNVLSNDIRGLIEVSKRQTQVLEKFIETQKEPLLGRILRTKIWMF